MKALAPILKKLHACDGRGESIEWAGRRKVSRASYLACDRGDWLLWIAAKVDVDRKLVVLAACDCAETALQYVPDGEDRPRIAIETARRWCGGKATPEQVRDAANAAAAAAARAAYDAAARAANAAAATSDANAANAAYADAYAADAAAYAAAAYAAAAYAAAAYAARKEALKHCADLVRARITFELLRDKLLEVAQ